MIDFTKLCQKFNEFRLAHQNTVYDTRADIQKEMRNLGINVHIFERMCKNNVFNTKRIGKRVQYSFKDIPLYKNDLKRMYIQYNSSIISNKNIKEINAESEAIKLLKSLGYKIQKPVGFNEASFRKDHPELYQNYTILEEI